MTSASCATRPRAISPGVARSVTVTDGTSGSQPGILQLGGLHLSGADEQGPQDATVAAVGRPKILWLLRLNGDPIAAYESNTRASPAAVSSGGATQYDGRQRPAATMCYLAGVKRLAGLA
jgi:hypothetical protein